MDTITIKELRGRAKALNNITMQRPSVTVDMINRQPECTVVSFDGMQMFSGAAEEANAYMSGIEDILRYQRED